MRKQYARGKNAVAECQRSGQKMRYRDLVEDGHIEGLLVHPDWWEPKHPQEIPVTVTDPVALYRPAPEISIPARYGDPESQFTFTGVQGDGTNWFDAGDVALFDFDENQSFSFELWVKPTGLEGQNKRIGGKEFGGNVGWAISYEDEGKTFIPFFSDGSNIAWTLGNPVTPASWVHLALTVDRTTNKARLYLNAILDPDYPLDLSLVGSLVNSEPFALFWSIASVNIFGGSLSDVRLWNDVRTAKEIKDNMEVVLTGTEANLIGYWRLNGGAGVVATGATDLTTNGNDLTSVGGGALTHVNGIFPTAPMGTAAVTGTISETLSGGETHLVSSEAVKHLFGQWLFIELDVAGTYHATRLTTAAESPTFSLPFTTAFPIASTATSGNNYYITQSGDPFDGSSP